MLGILQSSGQMSPLTGVAELVKEQRREKKEKRVQEMIKKGIEETEARLVKLIEQVKNDFKNEMATLKHDVKQDLHGSLKFWAFLIIGVSIFSSIFLTFLLVYFRDGGVKPEVIIEAAKLIYTTIKDLSSYLPKGP